MGVPTGAVSGTEDKYSLLSKTGLRSLTSEKKRGRQKLLHLPFHVKKEIIVFHLHEKNNNLFFLTLTALLSFLPITAISTVAESVEAGSN